MNPLQHFNRIEVKTVLDIIKLDSPSLSVIRKDSGEEKTMASLNAVIIDLAKFFSVGRGMNSEQVKETSRLVLKSYYYLKIEDLKLFSDNFKAGMYGKTFDRIDGNVILLAMAEYVESRMTEAESYNLQKHKEEIAAESQRFFLVKIGSNWLRSSGDNFEEVEQKELATNYTHGEAVNLKKWLQKEYFSNPNHVLVYDLRNCKSVFDYLEEKKPELLPQGEKSKRATKEYFEAKEIIMADTKLNEFEKENALRVYAKLEPISEIDFMERKKLLYENQ